MYSVCDIVADYCWRLLLLNRSITLIKRLLFANAPVHFRKFNSVSMKIISKCDFIVIGLPLQYGKSYKMFCAMTLMCTFMAIVNKAT